MAPNLSVEIHKPEPRDEASDDMGGGMDRATALDPLRALEWTRTVIDFTRRCVKAHIVNRSHAATIAAGKQEATEGDVGGVGGVGGEGGVGGGGGGREVKKSGEGPNDAATKATGGAGGTGGEEKGRLEADAGGGGGGGGGGDAVGSGSAHLTTDPGEPTAATVQ
jgi:hypothetical protein